jgi:hypothetical protein
MERIIESGQRNDEDARKLLTQGTQRKVFSGRPQHFLATATFAADWLLDQERLVATMITGSIILSSSPLA